MQPRGRSPTLGGERTMDLHDVLGIFCQAGLHPSKVQSSGEGRDPHGPSHHRIGATRRRHRPPKHRSGARGRVRHEVGGAEWAESRLVESVQLNERGAPGRCGGQERLGCARSVGGRRAVRDRRRRRVRRRPAGTQIRDRGGSAARTSRSPGPPGGSQLAATRRCRTTRCRARRRRRAPVRRNGRGRPARR